MPYFSRGPNKIQNPITFRGMYESYIEQIEEGSPYHVSYEDYISICEKFYQRMMDSIIENGAEFKMPYNLGKIYVDKQKINIKKPEKLAIDWDLTNKHGKVIYHLNEHSRGFKYIFVWEKKTFIIKNKKFYRFIPTRRHKRRLAKLIKSGNYDYFEHRSP